MNPFIGVWSLEAWTARNGADVSLPFGESPQGMLVYTAEGTMNACFMRSARQPLGLSLQEITAARRYWLGMPPGAAAPAIALRERFTEAALRFNSYAGRYTVEGERVHHEVEIALYPDWIGKRLTRTYRFEGDRLTLS